VHQVPVLLWTAAGMDMTHNPVWLEAFDTAPDRPLDAAPKPSPSGLRGYFMPEDDKSTIYIYEVDVK
jgi:hypothetical protein